MNTIQAFKTLFATATAIGEKLANATESCSELSASINRQQAIAHQVLRDRRADDMGPFPREEGEAVAVGVHSGRRCEDQA